MNANQIKANNTCKNTGNKGHQNKIPDSTKKQSKDTNVKERGNNPTNRKLKNILI